jgi:hypothetical protein
MSFGLSYLHETKRTYGAKKECHWVLVYCLKDFLGRNPWFLDPKYQPEPNGEKVFT